MIAHERYCSQCRRTILPRGGKTCVFCAYCGSRLDYQKFRHADKPGPHSRLELSTKTSGRAIAALVVAILAFPTCGPIVGIIAILLGAQARKEINASGGFLTGLGLANAGIALGLIATFGCGFWYFLLVLSR